MRSIRIAFLMVLISVLAAPDSSWASCGPAAVCGDTPVSFHGIIIFEGITATWSTDSEDSTVAYYKLKRYACANPATCSVDVATINAAGTCEQTQDYSYTDYPPAPVSSWTYTLEVWRSNDTRACGCDTIPQ